MSTYVLFTASVPAETVSIPLIRPVPLKVISPPPTVKSPTVVTLSARPIVTLPCDAAFILVLLVAPIKLTTSVELSLPVSVIAATLLNGTLVGKV